MSAYSVPNLLVPSPFRQLAALIGDLEPGAEPIDMSIGAPQHPLPDFVQEELVKDLLPLSHYPAITGIPPFRRAVADWLDRRYGLGSAIEERHVLALNGSREGLFYVAHLVKDICQKPDPVIVIPNPCYPTYIGAAKAAGCRIVTLPDTPTGLSDPRDVDAAELDKAVAVYFHSPSNPQGAVASKETWQQWIEAARKHKFFLVADECYSELYRDTPPVGALEAALDLGGSNPYERVVVLNSLSKRSNMPGIRAGFAAGDPDFITAFAAFRNVSGPQMPVPTQRVVIRALGDEDHVAANRKLYNSKFKLAQAILGVTPPAGGFFLWLDRGEEGGVATARRLWAQAGIRSVPGRYLTYDPIGGGHGNDRYLRLALVSADMATTKAALERVAGVLGHQAGQADEVEGAQ